MPVPTPDHTAGSAPAEPGVRAAFPAASAGGVISLPVLALGSPKSRGRGGAGPSGRGKGGPIRRSRNGPRRAAVLFLVHIIIAAHILLWLVTGMRTVTPVEPSEAMYTLEQGLVNAGFVFFVLALVVTLIFGRFFCGWACHVVALQDLCAWMMKRLGVRPKPFRSRLLIYVPLGLGLYMFVWPTFQRTVLQPIAGDRWASFAPYLGYYPPRPEFQAAFTTTDFWATFPPWYIAIPFLLVCGFGVVYFLGSKGFCTYGCPYGGFFAPIDRAAPGRIIVSDACEGCGHCTAVCSSNVRVHEEIREFGMVVDSGCMKCLDCVSVCPNNALSFGFAVPPIFKPPGKRAAGIEGGRRRWLRRSRDIRYDLTWPEEIAAAGLFLVLLVAYRGMFNSIPLLMAVGMAAIGTFLLWKFWRLLQDSNVRIQNVQLKYKGRLKLPGAAYTLIALMILATSLWGAVVKYNVYFADVHDDRVTVPFEVVFSAGYKPESTQLFHAQTAVRHLQRAGPWKEGGIGWAWSPQRRGRLAWLLAVAGEDEKALNHLRSMVRASAADERQPEGPAAQQLAAMAMLIARTGDPGDAHERIASELRAILDLRPGLAQVRLGLAMLELDSGNPAVAAEEAFRAGQTSEEPQVLLSAAGLLLETGDAERARELIERVVALNPGSAEAHANLAIVMVMSGKLEEAIAEIAKAHELEPDNPAHSRMMAQVLLTLGRHDEATLWLERANRTGITAPAPSPPVAR